MWVCKSIFSFIYVTSFLNIVTLTCSAPQPFQLSFIDSNLIYSMKADLSCYDKKFYWESAYVIWIFIMTKAISKFELLFLHTVMPPSPSPGTGLFWLIVLLLPPPFNCTYIFTSVGTKHVATGKMASTFKWYNILFVFFSFQNQSKP